MDGRTLAPGAVKDGRRGRTCPPAMSTTFGAGTTDGPSHVNEFGQSHGLFGFVPIGSMYGIFTYMNGGFLSFNGKIWYK